MNRCGFSDRPASFHRAFAGMLMAAALFGGERLSAQTPAYSVGHYGGGRLGGSGTVTDQWLPIPVVGIPDGIKLSVGEDHTLVIRANGTVWGWGSNSNGKLGNGNETEQWLAGQVVGLTNVVSIAACVPHSLAVKSDGTVWSWGYNGHGQLGIGNNNPSLVPVQIPSLSNAVAVSGGYHSLALLSDGTVRSWGYNGYGQLGDGTTNSRTTPVPVSGLSGVIAIAASHMSSDNHSLALKGDGTVWAWGNNGQGQLGDNTTTQRNTPVQVAGGLSNVIGIAAGHFFSMAVKSNGTVWAWGQNNEGQLGDGTTTYRNTPVQVVGITNALSIGAGEYHSFAITAAGETWGWGANGNGRLGDGTPVGRLTPVRVQGLLSSAVSGGSYHSVFLHAYDCNSPNPDCNGNGIHDGCDLLTSFSPDCNTNGVPDECDAAGATSNDCDGNIIPDECDNQSGNVTWNGGNGANYAISSNWTPAGPPRGNAQAYFSNAGASDNRSVISSDIGACSVVLQASGAGKQILQVNDDVTYFSGNGVTIGAGGELDLRGGTVSGGPVINQSNTIIGYGEIAGNLINSGSISVSNLSDMHFTGSAFDNQSSGELLAAAGARVRVTSPDVSQAGSIEIRSSAIFYTVQPLTNAAGGSILIYGGTLNAGSITNALDATIEGFGVVDGDLNNDGIVVTRADTQVVGDLENDGTVFNLSGFFTVLGNISGNGAIIGQPGGRAPGSGFAVSGDVSLADAGMISVPDGTLRVAGDADLHVADPTRFDLTTATLQFNGLPSDQPQQFATLAPDFGRRVSLTDSALYPIHRLRIGPARTKVTLVADQAAGVDAIYVNELTLDAGVTLDLAGRRLYYQRLIPSGTPPVELGGADFVLSNGAIIRDSVGGGLLCRIGSLRGDGDVNGDCHRDSQDVPGFVRVLLNIDTDAASRDSADMDANGVNDARDVAAFVTGLLSGN